MVYLFIFSELLVMAEHIVCITATGGIPLLTRTKQGCAPLSFPVIGSLNGVHMFGLNRDVTLLSTVTEDHRIVWKTYHDSVVLIAVAPSLDRKSKNQRDRSNKDLDPAVGLQVASRNSTSTVTDNHLLRLVDDVFNSLVLLTGLDELKNIRNVDRLKKDLRACYKLVDTFLDTGDNQSSSKQLDETATLFGDLTRCVDVVFNPEGRVLQDHLLAFVESADSSYGCLVFNGKVLCATEKWWLLDGQELALLGRLICILPASVTSCDIPVFLPHISPDVPYRLLVFTLVVGGRGGVRTCVLCGPEPSLTHVQENLVERFWAPAMSTLQKCCNSNDIPDSTRAVLPTDLLGFLLVDTEAARCLSHISPPNAQEILSRRKQQKNVNPYETSWIYGKLVEFYKFTVGTSVPLPENDDAHDDVGATARHIGLAHYRCMKRHKCFAFVKSHFQLFAVYSNVTPTFALQGLTERIFDALVKDGLV